MTIDWHSTSLLLLRIGLGVAFLVAAFAHTFTAPGWRATLHSTAVLLRESTSTPFSYRVILAARASLAWLFLVGIGITIGAFTTLSALGIIIFSILGFIIHAREVDLVIDQHESFGIHPDENVKTMVSRLLNSAISGNRGAGIKNVPIIMMAVALIIEGPGQYAVGP